MKKKAKQLKRFQVEWVDVKSIKPNKYNPNRQAEHEYKMLLRSMREDGFTTPIIVQRKTKEIVDGEHRWRAARDLGYDKIPVVFVEMTMEQMRISTLRHNRARGQEDVELTAELLRELEELGALKYAQSSLGMDDIEIQRLIEDVKAPEALAATEYSQPWQPGLGTTGQADEISATVEAADQLRLMEQKIKQAKTEQDREAARKDSQVYRVNLAFSDKEADIVKKVLGKRPAQKIFKWCQQEWNGKTHAAKNRN